MSKSCSVKTVRCLVIGRTIGVKNALPCTTWFGGGGDLGRFYYHEFVEDALSTLVKEV